MKPLFQQLDEFRLTGMDSARRSATLMLEGFAELLKRNVETAEQVFLVGTREIFEAASRPTLTESASRWPVVGSSQWQRSERIMQAYLQWAGNIQEQMAKAIDEQINSVYKPLLEETQEMVRTFVGGEAEARAPGRSVESMEPKVRRQAA